MDRTLIAYLTGHGACDACGLSQLACPRRRPEEGSYATHWHAGAGA